MLDRIIALCRAGFEKECAAELQFHANTLGHSAYVRTNDGCGYVQLVFTAGKDSPLAFFDAMDFHELIFTRQWFASSDMLDNLPDTNRLAPINDHIARMGMHFTGVDFCWPDTNDGKSISRFCKQFKPHLEQALSRGKYIKERATQRLQCLFLDSTRVIIGIRRIDNSASTPMGIRHLKMPAEAPSRSTLKLEEAINWFINEEDYRQFIKAGMTAVDLGAAPGGWTWQLTQRGMLVTAIDNGDMDTGLMESGLVEHIRADAFNWRPDSAIDWLVCDMVERPMHVSRLIGDWFSSNRCHYCIFNLKLPMNKRYQAVVDCLNLIHNRLLDSGIRHALFAKHLYHDREEITVFCRKLHVAEIASLETP